MVGKTISHYKVIEKLGQGGMGEVYLAEDSRLDRKVALKILPQHLSERAELRERFEREAKLLYLRFLDSCCLVTATTVSLKIWPTEEDLCQR